MHRLPILLLAALCCPVLAPGSSAQAERPNLLWLTSEDNGPHLGAYGDACADTPHLDRLAAEGQVYLHVWSNAPVCAPARTAIITGMYPTSTGSQHMRSRARLPEGMVMFPQLLREAGYYTANNAKEDYNLEKPGRVWDDSSGKAHWRNRPEGAPFFAVFNFGETHESRIRKRPHEAVCDPAEVRVPAYHPDAPEVRRDWAQYYDQLTAMDRRVGEKLAELERDGLERDTIVFYFGDHGPGLPRCKRWPYDSGLRVPLIVRLPERWRHLAPEAYVPGGRSARLVSFVDLAPTVLSLVGLDPPPRMQGGAFMGPREAPPRTTLHGFRGRMDERCDLVRSVRNERWVYLRNYMPHLPYGQHVAYMFQTPTTRIWRELYDAGKLAPPQTLFWERKPPEELYDLEANPDEVVNLAASPEHRATLERLRAAQRSHALEIRDLGFLPEAQIHSRSVGSTPYQLGRDPERYPLEAILEIAELASRPGEAASAELAAALGHEDEAVRYWGAVGILARGQPAVAEARAELRRALEDPCASVRIAAAEALARYGELREGEAALEVLVTAASLAESDVFTAILALGAIDLLDRRAEGIASRIEALPREHPKVPKRMASYVPRLIDRILEDLRSPR